MSDVQDARKRVKVWVSKIKKAQADKKAVDATVQAESLARAADLELIYQSFEWVNDMPAVNPYRTRGRRIDPKSREQYVKWVRQEYDGWGSSAYLTNLHQAVELVPIVLSVERGIEPVSERSLRPLAQLRNKGYDDDRVMALWREAIEAAEGNAPTVSQVRKAVNDYLTAAQKTLSKNTAADPKTRNELAAARHRKMLREFKEFMATDPREAGLTLIDIQKEWVAEHPPQAKQA